MSGVWIGDQWVSVTLVEYSDTSDRHANILLHGMQDSEGNPLRLEMTMEEASELQDALTNEKIRGRAYSGSNHQCRSEIAWG